MIEVLEHIAQPFNKSKKQKRMVFSFNDFKVAYFISQNQNPFVRDAGRLQSSVVFTTNGL